MAPTAVLTVNTLSFPFHEVLVQGSIEVKDYRTGTNSSAGNTPSEEDDLAGNSDLSDCPLPLNAMTTLGVRRDKAALSSG